jgi:peptide/nickel transport system substrate-binding protein
VTIGNDTVTIRLTAPNPRLLFLLTVAFPTPAGTPRHGLAGKAFPGTGPYMVRSFVPNRELLLVRNPRFHVWSPVARPDGYPDEIDFRMSSNPSRQLDEVAAGHADIALMPNVPSRIAALKTRYASQLHFNPQNATTFLFMNVRKPPFDDIRVRRALNYAVDRAKAAALEGGPDLAQPTCQVVPPPLPGYVRFCSYTAGADSSGAWKAPDLARAKQLIAASHTRGEPVVVWTFDYFRPDAKYFVSLLKQLGYRARLKSIPQLDPYFTAITKKHPQAGFGGWFGLTLPSDIFDTLGCNSAQNWADFCDPAFDRDDRRLIEEQGTDPAAAKTLAAALDRKVMAQAPWVPLWTPKLVDFTSRRVGNYQYNPYLFPLLDQMWVK